MKNKKIKHKKLEVIKDKSVSTFYFLISTFFPIFAFAEQKKVTDFKSFVEIILGIIKLLIPAIIGLSLVAFLWGLMTFLLNAGSDDKRKEGKRFMIWGIIALFVMISVWGIVELLVGSFGFSFGIPSLRIQ